MPRKTLFVVPFLVAVILGGWGSAAKAVEPASVVLNDSIRAVSQSAANGAVDTRRPFVSRAALKAEEASAPMTLELPLKIRNLPELEARVAKGERIPPQELMQKYMPAAKDYQAVVAWAKSQGLAITRQDDHNLAVYVRGSVGKIAGVFNVNFARVTFRGKEYTSAVSAPAVPASIAAVLQGITGLQPHLRPHKHSVRRLAIAAQGSQYTPAQIAAAYNVTPLYGNDLNGSGETIAISIDVFPSTSDLKLFWSDYGINQSISNIQFIQTVPGSMAAPSGEETLDTEWASSIAPGAKVRVYAATDLSNTDLDTQYQQIIDDATNHPELHIHALSMSYGSGETDTDGSELENDSGLFATMASQGISVFASSGDGGSTPDDNGGADGSLQPENPAEDPNVTGVGGTTLKLNTNNTVSSETVWNDISIGGGATGGGTSGSAESGGSFTGFARPSWQTGTGVNTSAKRQSPDLAATADPQFGGYVVLNGQTTVYGGTSLACPIVAAIFSLINEARVNDGEGTLGLVNPRIYPLLGSGSFTDTTSGNNYNSQNSNSLVGGVHVYSATTGYDECTGIGTPLGLQLAKVLSGSNNLIGVKFPVPQQEVVPSAPATFSVAVSGASPTYHWQRQPVGSSSFTNLSDGGSYSGSTTATLTISDTTADMNGDQFRCVVTLPSTTITTSPPSSLVVAVPLAVAPLAGENGVIGRTNGTGDNARFNYPSGVALANGNLYIADYGNNQIREVTSAGTVTTPFGSLIGASGSANGTGNNATFDGPNGIAADSSGNLYVADATNNSIRKISGNTVTTLASVFNGPEGVAVDSNSGYVYVADTSDDVIEVIKPGGVVSVFAGHKGTAGYRDGASGNALFNNPEAVAVDSSGNVWVADLGNSCIREISNGTVSTPAGTGGVGGYLDGPGKSALFNAPTGLSFDGTGNLFITDSLIADNTNSVNEGGNCLVRCYSTTGAVSTVAGDPGTAGLADGTGTVAKFYSIQALTAVSGGLYVCDTYNQIVRAVGSPTTSGGGSSGGSAPLITLSGLSESYTGSPQAITATTNPVGLPVTVTYSGSGYPSSTTPPTAVGSYTVTATVDDPPYSGTVTGTLVIAKATAAVTVNSLNISYSGTAQPVTVTTTPADLPVTVTYNGSTTVPTAVGTYSVIATVNSSDADYTGSGSGSLVINAVAATISLSNLNVTYTGKPQSVVATTTPPGLPVVVTYDGSLTAPSAVGSYSVVANINSANSSGSATGTLVIGQGVASITLGSLTAVYNGKPHAATATTVPARLAVSFTYGSSSYPTSSVAPALVGSYNVTATVNTTDYAGTQTGTLTITPVPPVATTLAATAITATGATLGGSANPEGSPTTLSFQYGPTTAYGSSSSGQSVGNGSAAVTAAIPISGLVMGTTYHYRAVANNGISTTYGADKTFLTLGPGLTTAPAAYLAASGAQLSLGINPNGVATSVYFIYSTDQSLATFNTTATQSLGAGKTAVNVTAFLSGLQAGHTYYYEAVITSGGVTYYSPEASFTALNFDTTLVVATGTTLAPGTNFTWAALGNAAVNEHDGAAFRATLTGAAAASNTGIWANVANAGSLSLVAQTGSSAPGTNGAVYSALTDPVYDNGGDVAFGGTLKVATGTVTAATENGVWASQGGTLALLAREGSAAPGTGGALFATFTGEGISDDGGAIVAGTLTNSTALGVTASNNAGVWEGSNSNSLTLMLRTGETTGTKTIASFSLFPVETYVNGQTRAFGPATGHLAVTATFTDKTSGIVDVTTTPGSPAAVATVGDTAAGTAGATFATFDSPAIDDNDEVAFRATLKPGVGDATAKNDAGIWAGYGAGTPVLIARLGQIAPGTIPGATFLTFSDPVENINGTVAFRATLSTGTSAATSTTNTGIWYDSTGVLLLAARTGQQAPGCPTGVTISAITELGFDDAGGPLQQGGVIFLATLSGTGVTTANNTAIFALDKFGAPQLIVRTGDTLIGKTITALTFLPTETAPVNGQGRSFSPSSGDLIYNATFSDKSQAIFNVTFE